ncbi:transposase [Nicoletella semolina]|nr:transposase [Nicoletella semolina]
MTDTLLSVIKKEIIFNSVVYTEYNHSYDMLDVSEFKHFIINHSTHFLEAKNHINKIENLWNKANKCEDNRIDKKYFPVFLQECEFRFNFGASD